MFSSDGSFRRLYTSVLSRWRWDVTPPFTSLTASRRTEDAPNYWNTNMLGKRCVVTS